MLIVFMTQVYAEATVVFPLLVAATFAKLDRHTNGVNGRSTKHSNVERSRERYKEHMNKLVKMASWQKDENGHSESESLSEKSSTHVT